MRASDALMKLSPSKALLPKRIQERGYAYGAVILILFAALVFLVGLVSEQIAALRYSRPAS